MPKDPKDAARHRNYMNKLHKDGYSRLQFIIKKSWRDQVQAFIDSLMKAEEKKEEKR